MRWRLLIPGLLDAEHYFQIEPLGPSQVRFVQGERFSGLLVPLAKRSLERGARAGFEEMNAAMKLRAEAPLTDG